MHRKTQFATVTVMALLFALPAGQAGSPPEANDQLDLIHPLSFGIKDGKPAVTGCSERIVEVPFVHRNLPYPFRGRILDVGYRESEIIYELASLGFETWGIDIRPPAAEYPGARYIEGDVIKYPFEAQSFDVVILLSTLEHIGLMAYGNTAKDPDGDLHALQAVHRILKPQGKLILTVPFGRRGGSSWYRVYDHQALRDLLARAGFSVDTEDYWSKDGVRWTPAHWSAAERIDSVTHHVQAVACVLARP